MPISIGSDSIFAMAAENAKGSAKANNLQKKLDNINSEAEDEQLMEACKSFEAYLVERMISAMEKTVPKNEENKNDYKSYFGDMLYQEYAQQITESGELGIAQQLYEAMKLNNQGL